MYGLRCKNKMRRWYKATGVATVPGIHPLTLLMHLNSHQQVHPRDLAALGDEGLSNPLRDRLPLIRPAILEATLLQKL